MKKVGCVVLNENLEFLVAYEKLELGLVSVVWSNHPQDALLCRNKKEARVHIYRACYAGLAKPAFLYESATKWGVEDVYPAAPFQAVA